MPEYYEKRHGAVLSSTINRYAHVTLFRRNDREVAIRSLDLDCCVKYSLEAGPVYDGVLDLAKAAIQPSRNRTRHRPRCAARGSRRRRPRRLFRPDRRCLRGGGIREVVETLIEITGFRGKIAWNQSRPDGQSRRMFDVSKAESELGFRAHTSLKEGLRLTVDWYRAHRAEARNAMAIRSAQG